MDSKKYWLLLRLYKQSLNYSRTRYSVPELKPRRNGKLSADEARSVMLYLLSLHSTVLSSQDHMFWSDDEQFVMSDLKTPTRVVPEAEVVFSYDTYYRKEVVDIGKLRGVQLYFNEQFEVMYAIYTDIVYYGGRLNTLLGDQYSIAKKGSQYGITKWCATLDSFEQFSAIIG